MPLNIYGCFQKLTGLFIITVFALIMMISVGCSRSDPPPHFSVRVVDVYGNEFKLDRFVLLYWWEERGETPFLYPYTHIAKQFIVEVISPLPDNPRRVRVSTEHIPFDKIDTVNITLGDTGKNINIKTVDGQVVSAVDNFPKVLKKGDKTGFADGKIFIKGVTADKEVFKLELNLARTIQFLSKSME